MTLVSGQPSIFIALLTLWYAADWYGRRPTIIAGCFIYTIGVILRMFRIVLYLPLFIFVSSTETAAHGLGLIVAGRVVAGLCARYWDFVLSLRFLLSRCGRGLRVGHHYSVCLGSGS